MNLEFSLENFGGHFELDISFAGSGSYTVLLYKSESEAGVEVRRSPSAWGKTVTHSLSYSRITCAGIAGLTMLSLMTMIKWDCCSHSKLSSLSLLRLISQLDLILNSLLARKLF